MVRGCGRTCCVVIVVTLQQMRRTIHSCCG
jgi:hypothetical protein